MSLIKCHECSGQAIVVLTVQEILDEHIAEKLA